MPAPSPPQGMAAPAVSLNDKYALDTTRAYMTGIEALVRLPMLQQQRDLERGLNTAGFISGYRGSPLGGLDQALWRASAYLEQHKIHFQPGINEDLAATAVWGSQQVNLFQGARYDGVFGMWYGKGPGVDRSMDAIRHANAFGTSRYGGVLAVAGDDHAAKSSSLPHQSEHMFIGASIPVLCPANVQEVLDLGIFGWELSRYCGAWVALKAITENMDSAISAEIDPARVNIVLPTEFELPQDGVHARWPDTALEQERRLNKYKIYAAREFARVNRLNRVVLDSDRPRLGIITTGKAYLDVMQALEDLGIDEQKAGRIGLRVFKVGMSWPLEPVSTHAFADGLEEILVVEEKRSIIEDQLTGQLYNWPVEKRPRVIGEFDEQGSDLLPNLSELTPARVARVIAARIARFYRDEAIQERLQLYEHKEKILSMPRKVLTRLPHYCSGCPHSQSTRVPEGSRAMGGIGCHYMGLWESGDRRCETFTQMGGEGVTWTGQAPFTETNHVFQNLGDGTYFHSGLLAIRQTIAAGTNITYKILYNDAVAMTGGQAVDGMLSVEQMIQQLRGEGVKRIALISDYPDQHRHIDGFPGYSLHHRDQLLPVEEELKEIPGTSILIYEQTCAAEKRRRRKRGLLEEAKTRVFINPEVCEGCGDCSSESNCLSVIPQETELGRKRQIDQSACNKDYSCLRGFCPSFVTVTGEPRKQAGVDLGAAGLPDCPTPALAPIDSQPWNVVVTGVGGTGVLTVASVLAMAAHLEGKGCATMNQTGLAQKFGAVVSHVRIATTQAAINAVRIPAGDADLLLGCDLVVAASDESITRLNDKRSYAIVNDYAAASAELVSNPDAQVPRQAMQQAIEAETRGDGCHFVPATQLAEPLMGDSIAANMFLLGMASQRGLLPVSVEALRGAIELNDVAVEFNLNAFEWGRHAVESGSRVESLAGLPGEFEALQDIDAIVADRTKRLTAYQSARYADRYRQEIEELCQLEDRLELERDYRFSKAAARSLYKLMAYKDEYEVARLYSDGDFARLLKQKFEPGARVNFHLAPPLLALLGGKDARGYPKKWRFPGITRFLFRVLAGCRGLRGSALDVFAYSQERREALSILAGFEAVLEQLGAELNQANYDVAIELAELPLQIRGFGPVRARHVASARARQAALLKRFRGETVQVVEISERAA